MNPKVRIITVSGSAGAVQPGDDMTDLRLTKPYSMGTLLNGLRQVLPEAHPVVVGPG
jgi:hypothetical protein